MRACSALRSPAEPRFSPKKKLGGALSRATLFAEDGKTMMTMDRRDVREGTTLSEGLEKKRPPQWTRATTPEEAATHWNNDWTARKVENRDVQPMIQHDMGCG